MSKRLDSLTPKKPATPGAKLSLKFKPKTVARKTKEERDKSTTAPIKQEPVSPRMSRSGPSSRGRGGRGGRANYAGTLVVSSGPLASGSVSMGLPDGAKTQNKIVSVSSAKSVIDSLKVKQEPGTSGSNSDDEDVGGPTRINMSREYPYEESETVLFPVRPGRQDESSPEPAEPADAIGSSAALESTSAPTTYSPSVDRLKSEALEEKLEQIRQHKTEIENKIAEPVDLLDKQEYNKLIDDHQKILNLVTQFEALETDDKYVLVQLPKILPDFQTEGKENGEVQVKSEIEEPENVGHFAAKKPSQPGQIGHLNIHQSGKISISMGENIKFTVAQGAGTNFLQELVVIEGNSEDRDNAFRVGQVDGKIIATPKLQ